MSDLIERQAAIDALSEMHCKSDEDGYVWIIRSDAWWRIETLPSAEPEPLVKESRTLVKDLVKDTISRRAAIDAVDSETVSTNPEHFKSSEKFIKFMDDADIASFGKWQWANGFDTALVATTIQLKQLPSTQPETVRCKDCMYYGTYYRGNESKPVITHLCKLCLDRTMEPDDFCSRAERRTDEGD